MTSSVAGSEDAAALAAAGWQPVATLALLDDGPLGRLSLRLASGRHVLLLRSPLTGAVHAMDSRCYHHGGPLDAGDIEDAADGTPCIVCPWHRYLIAIETGDSIYTAVDPFTKATSQKSKGVKQRVHPTRVVGDVVFVLDSGGSGGSAAAATPAACARRNNVASDAYAFLAVPPPQPLDAAASVPLHSHFPGRRPPPR